MAKKLYIGVNGVAQEAEDIFVGVNGVAKKVIKGYVGVENEAKLFWDKQQQIILPTWKYYTTNSDKFLELYHDEELQYRYINTSGNLIVFGIVHWYTSSSQTDTRLTSFALAKSRDTLNQITRIDYYNSGSNILQGALNSGTGSFSVVINNESESWYWAFGGLAWGENIYNIIAYTDEDHSSNNIVLPNAIVFPYNSYGYTNNYEIEQILKNFIINNYYGISS